MDNIIKRVDLQQEAYSKENGIPSILFDILADQKKKLSALKDAQGSIVSPEVFK